MGGNPVLVATHETRSQRSLPEPSVSLIRRALSPSGSTSRATGRRGGGRQTRQRAVQRHDEAQAPAADHPGTVPSAEPASSICDRGGNGPMYHAADPAAFATAAVRTRRGMWTPAGEEYLRSEQVFAYSIVQRPADPRSPYPPNRYSQTSRLDEPYGRTQQYRIVGDERGMRRQRRHDRRKSCTVPRQHRRGGRVPTARQPSLATSVEHRGSS